MALSNTVLPCSTGIFPVDPEDLGLFYRKAASLDARYVVADFFVVSVDMSSVGLLTSQPSKRTTSLEGWSTLARRQRLESIRKKFSTKRTGRPGSLIPLVSLRSSTLYGVVCSTAYTTCFLKAMTLSRLCVPSFTSSTFTVRVTCQQATQSYHIDARLGETGPGSFFKAHKDTPRSEDMFASLVVVLPTTHQGGRLTFRHRDFEYVFDSGEALSQATSPSVAFAAFYSDVEHEVTLVESGYRVTLTYNLYFHNTPRPSSVPFAGAYQQALKAAFLRLLSDTTYCRNGGYLGFGLRHEYPSRCMYSFPDHLKKCLKGSDAVLRKVCRDLGLQARLKILYHTDAGVVLSGYNLESGVRIESAWDYPSGTALANELRRDYRGKLVCKPDVWGDSADKPREQQQEVELQDKGPLVEHAASKDDDGDREGSVQEGGEDGELGEGSADNDKKGESTDGGDSEGEDGDGDEDEDEEEQESDDSDDDDSSDEDLEDEDEYPTIKVLWATPVEADHVVGVNSPYIAMGNQPSLEYVYSTFCLIVKIDPADVRVTSGYY